jgi:tRNA(Ile)-lysidine synthase
VAHHADDQAETLLLHLVRGSGVQGLGAMRWVTTVPGVAERVRLVRPLLAVRRQTLLAYARAHHLTWREDSTNREYRFLRNRVRHEVLPLLAQLNPNIVDTLGRSAASLAADAERLNALDKLTLEKLCAWGTWGGERFVLDLDQWLALDAGSRRGVLRRALAQLASAGIEIGFQQIEKMLEEVERRPEASGPHPIAGGLCWSLAGARGSEPARLSIHAAAALPFAPAHPFLDEAWRASVGSLPLSNADAVDMPGGWQLAVERMAVSELPENWRTKSQPWSAYFDAAQMEEAVLTTPRPGMRIAPLGMGGKGKTLGDLFTDDKIPVTLREGWPLIVDRRDATVHWVCGLALAERACITERTTAVVALRWQRRSDSRIRPTTLCPTNFNRE